MSWMPGESSAASVRIGRRLFVTNENVFKFILFENRIIDFQNSAAGIAKYKFDIFFS